MQELEFIVLTGERKIWWVVAWLKFSKEFSSRADPKKYPNIDFEFVHLSPKTLLQVSGSHQGHWMENGWKIQLFHYGKIKKEINNSKLELI